MNRSVRQLKMCLVVLVCTGVFAPPRFAARDGSETPPVPLAVVASSQTDSPFIVIGFLGGFVSHDEPHHPEVQMIQALRREFPQRAYFGLFENRKVGEAYKTILSLLGAQRKVGDYQMTKSAKLVSCYSATVGAPRLLSPCLEDSRE